MRRTGNVKRLIGLAMLVSVTGGALLVATPSSAVRPTHATTVRDARPAVPKSIARPARATAQAQGSAFGQARSSRRSAEQAVETVTPDDGHPSLEPWSLIAGALSVMVFLARRRRTD